MKRSIDDLRDCLIRNYAVHGPQFCADATGYTLGYVRTAACILGLQAPWHGGGGKTKGPRWQPSELAILKREYGRTRVAMLSARLTRTSCAIHRKASAIGLGTRRGMRWDAECDAILKRTYPRLGAKEAAAEIGCSVGAARHRAKALGIRRDVPSSHWFKEQ